MARRKEALGCLIANLAVFEMHRAHYDTMAINLRNTKRLRYDKPGMSTDVLRGLVRELSFSGWLKVHEYKWLRRSTGITPGALLSKRFASIGLQKNDVIRLQGGESLALRERQEGHINSELIEYRDTAETERMRREITVLNAVISSSVISFDNREMLTPHLVRIFSGTFERHGRLYAWWQSIPKTERYKLRISGEPVADLDFSSMFVQLAYWRTGSQMPGGDPYVLPGLERPDYRPIVKRLFNSLFFRKAGKPASRLPKGFSEKLPAGFTMADFVRSVEIAHPQLAPLINTEIGYELFKAESDILVAALLKLAEKGIVGLGMHDGMMVAQSAKLEAVAAMEAASLQVTGLKLKVVEKAISVPSGK
jgi:hypothetical protein